MNQILHIVIIDPIQTGKDMAQFQSNILVVIGDLVFEIAFWLDFDILIRSFPTEIK